MSFADLPTKNEIRVRLLEGNSCSLPPLTNKLPFPYHFIPGDVRMWLGRLLFSRNLKKLRTQQRQPGSYADNSTDLLISALAGETDLQLPTWQWPEGKSCALVVSHDIDTPGQEKGVELLRAAAEKRGLRSTFSFVGSNLKGYEPLIRDLRSAGHEIALHDMHHDNRVAFLAEAEVVARLLPLKEAREAHGIVGFRSPSWYTSAALWRGLDKVGFQYDMSVLDSWPFFDPDRNFGVASLFPFSANGLVILPNTVPYDDTPWFCGYNIESILAFWKPKLDWIAGNQGLIMLNAHPDRWWSGSKRAAEMFGQTLDYILDQHEPARLRAIDVANHFRAESVRGATIALAGDPRLEIPRHGDASMQPPAFPKNPMLVSAAEYIA
jgi:peptidoglycan/xylan/chitin deacetylase (PgdA/CDA1 family)